MGNVYQGIIDQFIEQHRAYLDGQGERPDGNHIWAEHVSIDNADLEGAKLIHGCFNGSSCRNVNFRGADLRWCYFKEADLTAADFTGANLFGACFDGARLDGTIFDNTILETKHRKEPPKPAPWYKRWLAAFWKWWIQKEPRIWYEA